MEVENKRIKGARVTVYNNIKFRSSFECSCYKRLEQLGLEFYHEPERVELWKGLKLQNISVYAPNKVRNRPGVYERDLSSQTNALRNLTYTPDFLVVKDKYRIYFDAKGKENDTYPIKKKMFLKHLDERNDGLMYIFMEPHSIRQMLQAIDIINSL